MTQSSFGALKFLPLSGPRAPVITAQRRTSMKNPLDSLWGTVISGVILTAILYFVVKSLLV